MRTRQGNLLTDVILAVFRANGRVLSSGDTLVALLGLTSARWQVLGAVGGSDLPLSAPQIASTMGVTRQGAQKQIHRLVVRVNTVNEGHLFKLSDGSPEYIKAGYCSW